MPEARGSVNRTTGRKSLDPQIAQMPQISRQKIIHRAMRSNRA
jgi:hypothetical protein